MEDGAAARKRVALLDARWRFPLDGAFHQGSCFRRGAFLRPLRLLARVRVTSSTLEQAVQPMGDAEPLVCRTDAIPVEDRAGHRELIVRLFQRVACARAAIPNGYAFRFDPDELASVARFVESERLCCPFLEIGITVAPSSGPVTLRLTGPEGTREFLDAELFT